ncbi:MAG: glutaredoxin [Myxococcales bacterium]|nr:glutaredoxin [Myxococcales bacterium]
MPSPLSSLKLPKDLAAKVKTSVLTAIDRADELGGDLRDYLQDRWTHDPRLAKLKARFGGAPAAARPVPAPVAQAIAVAATTPPPVKSDALGDPDIKAQIYGKSSCPWTGRAMTVLEKYKVDYDFVDIEQPEHEALQVRLSSETKQHTVPYVYLRGHFVGGFNALAEIERLGQLDAALLTPAERAALPAHQRGVEIVARPNTDEVVPADDIAPTDGE